MTMMSALDNIHYRGTSHSAILVSIECSVNRARAVELMKDATAKVEADKTPEAECSPLWLVFDDLDGSKFKHLLGYGPLSKAWLDAFLKSIPEGMKYQRIRDFDPMSGKRAKHTQTKAAVPFRSQFEDRFPDRLKFMATFQAAAECSMLGDMLQKFRGGMADMDAIIVSLDGSFPSIARADRLMGGSIVNAMRLIGEHHDLRLGAFQTFIQSLRCGAIHLLKKEADSMSRCIHHWYHNDDGSPRDMPKFLGHGSHDSLMGANLSPVQDMTEEATEFGPLRSTVTVKWLDRRDNRFTNKARVLEEEPED